MSSLVSTLRFSLVFQVVVAAAWHFFQWFAWSGDLALVRRSDLGEVTNTALLLIVLVLTLGWWAYLTTLVWQLRRGAAFQYVLFLIFMPLASTVGDAARDFPRSGGISGLDVLYYMNGVFIFSLTTLTPLRKFLRIAPENGSFSRKIQQRLFWMGACFMLFLGIIAQRTHPEPRHGTPCNATCRAKCSAKAEKAPEILETSDAAAPARQ